MLHQFSRSLLDFLTCKIQLSKRCGLKPVSAPHILPKGTCSAGVSSVLVWDVFWKMKTPFEFPGECLLGCTVCSEILRATVQLTS